MLGSINNKLCLCDWGRATVIRRLQRFFNAPLKECQSDILTSAAGQLDEYFAGKRTSFTLPLVFAGTEFQNHVWQTLLQVPYGATLSYGEIARRIGLPSAVRAVANAIGANAMSIIVPCHRIIGTNGSPTGYAGGLPAKQFLLNLELTKS